MIKTSMLSTNFICIGTFFRRNLDDKRIRAYSKSRTRPSWYNIREQFIAYAFLGEAEFSEVRHQYFTCLREPIISRHPDRPQSSPIRRVSPYFIVCLFSWLPRISTVAKLWNPKTIDYNLLIIVTYYYT